MLLVWSDILMYSHRQTIGLLDLSVCRRRSIVLTMAVASPGCFCKEGQRWKLCHGALTVDFMAGSITNSFATNAVPLIERDVSC